MAFRWASIANGVKETDEDYQGRKAAEAPRLDATMRAPRGLDSTKQAPRGLDSTKQAPRGLDSTKQAPRGLDSTKQVPRGLDSTKQVPRVLDATMRLPKGVNGRAADFAELFVWQTKKKCTSCLTVKDLKALFNDFYVNYLISTDFGYGGKYITDYAIWRGTVENSYETFQQWAAYHESTTATPWFNKTYIFVHHVTFEAVLWALSVASGTFRTDYNSEIPDETNGGFKSGFLKVTDFKDRKEAAPILWVVTDISAYRSTPRTDPKPLKA